MLERVGNSGRIYGLDIVRCFAILFLVWEHGGYMIMAHINAALYYIPVFDGVTLFFVLSGFLIGGILLDLVTREQFNQTDLFRFWVYRWFRTLPLYFLVLVFLLAYEGVGLQSFFSNGFYKFLFFIQNFNGPPPPFFAVSWTLSVEEWFYLLVPFFLYLTISVTKFSTKSILLFYIALVIFVCTALRVYRVHLYGYIGWDMNEWDQHIRKVVITRLDSIMIGFLGAYIKYYYKNIWSEKRNVFFALACLLMLVSRLMQGLSHFSIFDLNMVFARYLDLTVTAFGALLLLPKMDSIKTGSGLIYKATGIVSRISYSMYLLHYSVVQVIVIPFIAIGLKMVIANNTILDWVNYSLYWIVTILLSYAVYKYFEVPTTNLRKKFG